MNRAPSALHPRSVPGVVARVKRRRSSTATSSLRTSSWPLVLAVCLTSCAWWQGRGRVFTGECTYVGVRGHVVVDGSGPPASALTVMIETDAPSCREIYTRR